MTFLSRSLLLAPALLVSFSAAAVDLREVFDLAVENDPQIGAAEAVYLASSEGVNQARAGMLPNVSVGGSTSDNWRRSPDPQTGIDADPTSPTFGEFIITGPAAPAEEFNSHGWAATLSQPVFRLDRWFRFRQSKNLEAQALATFAAEQQNLIIRVADTYLNILEAQDTLSAANAEREAVKRQLEQVQQRFDVGLVAITDVLEAQAAYDTSTVTVINAEGNQNIAFEPLFRLTGQGFRDVGSLAEEFPVKYPDPLDEEAWVASALANNLDIAAAREGVNAARRQLYIARSGHLPTVDAQAQWQHSTSGGQSFLGNTLDQRVYSLQIDIPVYAGGSTRSVARQSGYQLEQAQLVLDLTQRQIVETTRNLYTAINTDVARVRARLRGIESSQSALDATQTGYEVGTRNIVDVLQAQQRLFASQLQFAQARYQYIRNTFRLKQVVGSLSPEDIYELNNFINNASTVERITPTTR